MQVLNRSCEVHSIALNLHPARKTAVRRRSQSCWRRQMRTFSIFDLSSLTILFFSVNVWYSDSAFSNMLRTWTFTIHSCFHPLQCWYAIKTIKGAYMLTQASADRVVSRSERHTRHRCRDSSNLQCKNDLQLLIVISWHHSDNVVDEIAAPKSQKEYNTLPHTHVPCSSNALRYASKTVPDNCACGH